MLGYTKKLISKRHGWLNYNFNIILYARIYKQMHIFTAWGYTNKCIISNVVDVSIITV